MAQSFGPAEIKTEQRGTIGGKTANKKRKKKRRSTLRRKSGGLQKSYYKKKSNQTQYPGNVSLRPRPKDFTAINERVERNPSRTRLKASKNRASYFRASSNKMHKSFGSAAVARSSQRTNYQYSTGTYQAKKRENKSKVTRQQLKKSSKTKQNFRGNMNAQPKATRRDYNEIRDRVDQKPGQTMARKEKQQERQTRSNVKLAKKYRGDLWTGTSKQKNQELEGKSKNLSTFQGRSWTGSMKNKNQEREGKSLNLSSFQGNFPTRTSKEKDQELKSKSKNLASYQGNMWSASRKHKNQELEGKSLNSTSFQGNFPTRTNKQKDQELKSKSKNLASFQGKLWMPTKKHKDQE